MPTGYTAGVGDGTITDFRTFALMCARQFGATIMQREEPLNSLPKLREESDHARNELAKHQGELERLCKLTIEQAAIEQNAELEKRKALNTQAREDNRIKRERYEQMLTAAQAWTPPTLDHMGLKEFMLKQLEKTIDYDCNDEDFVDPPTDPTSLWLQKKIEHEAKMVRMYAEDVIEERVRVNKSNAWIEALWRSV